MPSSDTYFYPGQPKTPGSGRKPGTPNKRPPLAAPAIDHLTASLVPSLQSALEKMATGKDYERRAERYVTQVIRLLHVTDRLGPGMARDMPYLQAKAEMEAMNTTYETADLSSTVAPAAPLPVATDADKPDPAIKRAEDELLDIGNTLIAPHQQMEEMMRDQR
jgi:hypothetical protein